MAEDMTFEELQEMVSICLSQITDLKNENKILRDKIDNLSLALNDIVAIENQLITSIEDTNVNMLSLGKSIDNIPLENLKYELNDPSIDNNLLYFPKLYKIEDTIECIINGKKSMARFGDGEFAIMCNKEAAVSTFR